MPMAKNVKADSALALYRQGMKLVDIAKELEIPEGTIRRWKCNYDWDGKKASKDAKKKTNARKKMGAPFGNKNAVGNKGGAPKGNQNAKRWGMLSKYIPKETMDILGITADTTPLDLLWDQIQIAYIAIIRAQQISFVADKFDMTKEIVSVSKNGSSNKSVAYEIQQAWDKHGSFMKSQAIAQAELRALIKQYDEMIHRDWDIITEEQKARLQLIQNKLEDNGVGQDAPVLIINDTK